MGEPVTGSWGRIYTVPYSGAAKWGTGVNPIHQFYGDMGPLRTYGRQGDIPDLTPPGEATGSFVTEDYGYMPEDIAGLDVYAFSEPGENWRGIQFIQDGWPDWSETTPQTRGTTDGHSIYPVGSPGIVAEMVRRFRFGPRDDDYRVSNQIPTETVNEGWLNKPASGMDEGYVPDAVVSSPAQYEMQTSMQQRYRQQENARAVARGTDDQREPIESRVAPMRLKVYSEGERHYDMFPRQIDDIPRPFWYRRAGTGRSQEMEPNAMVVISPLQRTVPPDPSLGPEETSLTEDGFGYTSEDSGWY